MGGLGRWMRTIPLRTRSFVYRRKAERDLSDELEFHFEQEIQRHVARGLTPEHARSVVRRQMYGIEAFKDACRDARHALRMLRRSPSFTAVAVLILAVGIGVNAAVFTVADAALFKGFRLVHHNDRILYVHSTRNGLYSGVSYPDFVDWQRQAKSFQGMGVVGDMKVLCEDADGVRQLCSVTRVTAGGFRLLGPAPILGRSFLPSDDVPGATPVAILSYGFWESRFGRNQAVIGQTLRLSSVDQVPHSSTGVPGSTAGGALLTTVIGVMPQGFAFPKDQDLWVPVVPTTPDVYQRDARGLWIAFGRLAEGVSREAASAELSTIGRRLEQTYPRTNQGEMPQVESFAEFFVDRNAPIVYRALWGAVGLLLLIACANLGSLLLARTIGRSREIAIRAAIGAGRWRIIRQLLIESLVLSAIGGACGWVIAHWGVRIYELSTNPPVGEWNRNLLDYSMDSGVFVYFLAISLGAGLLFGLAPLLWSFRINLNAVMKDGGLSAAGSHRGRSVSTLLVVAEIALAMVLVVGAGLMTRSFLKMYSADVGANTENIATMLLRLPVSKYPEGEGQTAFYERLKQRVEAIPGVESMTLGPAPASSTGARLTGYDLYDRAVGDGRSRPMTAVAVIGPDYFRTLGATILSGREFTQFDDASAPPVAILNHQLARQQWPRTSVIGQRLRLDSRQAPGRWLTVVGVTSNVVYDPRRQQTPPMVYVSSAQTTGRGDAWVLVRTSIPVDGVLNDLRRVVDELDRDVLIWLGPYALRDQLALTVYGRKGNQTALLVAFATIALSLAAIGLYAVLAHAVTQRIQEIGVRTAMGATARDIRALIFKQGMRPVALGLAIGIGAAMAAAPVLNSVLVGVVPHDPTTVTVGSVVLMVAAVLGCAIPAHRASCIDPILALRKD